MRARLRKLAKVLAGLLLLLLLLAALTGLGTLGWLHTRWGRAYVARRVEAAVDDAMAEGDFSLGGVERLDLLGHLVLRDVVLRDTNGREVVRIDSLSLRLQPLHLLHKRLLISQLLGEGVRVDTRADAQGVLELQRMFPPSESEEPWAGLPLSLSLPEVVFDGLDLSYTPNAGNPITASEAELRMSLRGEGTEIVVQPLALSTQLGLQGQTLPSRLDGGITYTPQGLHLNGLQLALPDNVVTLDGDILLDDPVALTLKVDIQRLGLEALDPLVSSPGIRGAFRGDLELSGPLDGVWIRGSAHGVDNPSHLAWDTNVDLLADPLSWSGQLAVGDLQLQDVYPASSPVLLNGILSFDGSGSAWPDGLQASGRFESSATLVVSELPLDDVSAEFTLADGKLMLQGAHLDGILGLLDINGELDLAQGPMQLRVRGPIQLARLAAFGQPDIKGFGSIDLVLRGDIKNGGPYRGAGVVWLRPLRYGNDIRLAEAEVDVRFSASAEGAVEADLSLRGSGLDAYGAHFARLRLPALRVVREQDGDLAVSGRARLAEGGWGELASVATLQSRFEVAMPNDGVRSMRADTALGSFQTLQLGGSGGALRIGLHGDALRFNLDLEDGEREWLSTGGNFNLSSGWIHLDHLRSSPVEGVAWVDDGPGKLRLTASGFEDADLTLTGPLGELMLKGALGSDGEVDAELTVKALQLEAVAKLAGEQLAGLSGLLQAQVQLRGDAHAPELDARLSIDKLALAGSLDPVDLVGSVDNNGLERRVRLDLALRAGKAKLGKLQGVLPLRLNLTNPGVDLAGRVDLTLVVPPGPLRRFSALLPDSELPEGVASARLELQGPVRDPRMSAAGVAQVAVEGWSEPGRVEFELRRREQIVHWGLELREGYAERARVRGKGNTRLVEAIDYLLAGGPDPDLADWTLYLDEIKSRVRLRGVPVRSLARAMGKDVALEGALKGEINLHGSPYRPKVVADVRWVKGRIGDQRLQDAKLVLEHDETGYQLDAKVVFKDPTGKRKGQASVSGRLPVAIDLSRELKTWGTGPLDLRIEGEGVPMVLAKAFDPDVHEARGRLSFSGAVLGALDDPQINLRASLEKGVLAYAPFGLRLDDLTLDLQLDNDAIQLRELSANTWPLRTSNISSLKTNAERDTSRLRVRGLARLDGWAPSGIEGDIRLERAWLLSTPEYQFRVDGGLVLSGGWPGVILRDDGAPLELIHGQIDRDAASFLVAAPLSVDPAITIQRGKKRVLTSERVEERPITSDMDVDLRVALRRNLMMNVKMAFADQLGSVGATASTADLSARVASDKPIRVRMQGGETDITGEVTVLDGRVRVLQGQFELSDDSTVSFIGADVTNPTLNIDGTMRSQSGEIRMRLRGTPTTPNINFSSDELADETQILLMLATGRDPSELDADQVAYALGSMAISSMLGSSQLRNVSFDPDGTVRIGLALTQTVTAEYRYRLGADQGLSGNASALDLEWAVLPRLVLDAGVGQRFHWADAYWQVRF